MSRVRKNEIIDNELIYTKEEIRNINFKEVDIYALIQDKEKALELIIKLGIIPNERKCPLCLKEMSLVRIKRKQSSYIWKCDIVCKKSLSITSNSFFELINMEFGKFLLGLYQYFKKNEISEISENIGKSRSSISRVFNFIREIIADHFSNFDQQIGGLDINGEKKIVEIDESLFFKRNYNRGRLLSNQWFIGGIKREPEIAL